ncbi:MAG: patatin-like phospholipase family protein [Alkalispirochaeta sp.]
MQETQREQPHRPEEPASAKQPGQQKRTGTLGVALAGGGALGFAHLGVILVMEELGISPDYISGASIGSIVGALYAVGYTGEEMLKVVESVEWDDVLFDQPLRTNLTVEAREATRRYRLSAQFNRGQLVTPSGVSPGQRATEFLDRLLTYAAGVDDFRDLPRPIGIVATDLVSGGDVVYTTGDLKSAVRGSFAVPGVFTPLYYDGRYVIDGGWSNNLPVDVVRDLGADHIIAIDLFDSDRSIEELQDIPTIVEQSGIILRQQRVDANAARADVLITPDLHGYTPADFDRALELVEIGRSAAEARREDLIALRDTIANERTDAKTDTPVLGPRPEAYHLETVRVYVQPDRQSTEALDLLRSSLEGTERTLSEIRDAVYRLYDQGGFEYLSYDLSPDRPDDSSDASGDTPTEEVRPASLDIYAVPEKQYRSEVQLGFGVRIIFDGTPNNRSVLHGNYSSLVGAGDRFRLESDLWITEVAQARLAMTARILGPIRFGVAGYNLAPPLIRYDNRTVEALYLQRRTGAEAGFELPLFQRATLGLGGFIEHFALDHVQGSRPIEEFQAQRLGINARVHYDTLDRAFFPTRGGEAAVSYRQRFDDEDRAITGRLAYSGRRFFPLSERLNLQLRLEGGSDLNSDLPPYEQYVIGGGELFEGYYYQELSGNHILTVGGDLRWSLFRLPLGVGESVYLRAGGNIGRIWDESFDTAVQTDWVWGGRLGVAVNTGLGELNVAYAINDEARSIVYVLLGPAYTFGGNGYQW